MKSVAKSIAWMRDLKDRLDIRVEGSATIDTVRAALDVNGWSVLFLSDGGSEVAGADVIYLRIKSIDNISKDIF